MKKSVNLFLVMAIAFFTIPFGSMMAQANEKAYEDIADGEYEITAKALHADEEEASGAAGFIDEAATLSVKEGKVKFTITVPHNDMAEIAGLQIENNEPTVDGETWTYDLDALKKELHAQVQYEVPMLNMKHDVPFRFMLEGLDDLPVKEETPEEPEQPEAAPEERVVGEHITESEADAVYELEYETDSASTKGQLLNPVKLLEKADKQYIQIPVNERGADYFRSLKMNGTQVIWNSLTEGPYTIQFELPGEIEDTFLLDMVIQAGPNAMPHEGIEINFNTDTMKTIKEPQAPEEPEDTEKPEEPKEPEDTEKPEEPKEPEDTEKPEEPKEPEDTEKPEEPKGPEESEDENEGLEKPKEESSKEDPKEQTNLTPDKVEKYNYVVKHATEDELSAADNFFTKPAHVLYKDGEKYLQFTVTSWSMIDWLRTDQGDVTVIKVNEDDSALLQVKLPGDIADFIDLNMHITVPGLYEMEHAARLYIDVASAEEIEASDFQIVLDKATPQKPAFGSGDNGDKSDKGDKGNEDKTIDKGNKIANQKTINPNTGDTTNILLYTVLLIGSLSLLGMKFRRRLMN